MTPPIIQRPAETNSRDGRSAEPPHGSEYGSGTDGGLEMKEEMNPPGTTPHDLCADAGPNSPRSHQPYGIGSDLWPGLSKLTEEMGECAQVVGKIIGAGGAVEHWDGGPPLNERLMEEISDVMAACQFVALANRLDVPAINARIRKKLTTFNGWHADEAARATGPRVAFSVEREDSREAK